MRRITRNPVCGTKSHLQARSELRSGLLRCLRERFEPLSPAAYGDAGVMLRANRGVGQPSQRQPKGDIGSSPFRAKYTSTGALPTPNPRPSRTWSAAATRSARRPRSDAGCAPRPAGPCRPGFFSEVTPVHLAADSQMPRLRRQCRSRRSRRRTRAVRWVGTAYSGWPIRTPATKWLRGRSTR